MPGVRVIGEMWNVPKYFVAFGMILTLLEEQKRTADARSQEYRGLFENNPHPMWIFDAETLRFLAVNDAAVVRYGYSAEEFRGMTLRDIRPATVSTGAPAHCSRTASFPPRTRYWMSLTLPAVKMIFISL